MCSTLSLDGTVDDGLFNPLQNEKSLMDQFDYVMHGRVFMIKLTAALALKYMHLLGGY